MIACTSPAGTCSDTPFRIGLSATVACRLVICIILLGCALRRWGPRRLQDAILDVGKNLLDKFGPLLSRDIRAAERFACRFLHRRAHVRAAGKGFRSYLRERLLADGRELFKS